MATGQEPTNGEAVGRTPGRARPREDARRLKEKAIETGREARQRGKEQLEAGKSSAADQVQKLAGVVERAAGELQQQDDSLAGYAGDLAGGMSRFAEGLRSRSIDELAGEVQSLARRNPTVFLLGSVALGIALSRFLKASAQRESEAMSGGRGYGPDGDVVTESQGPGTPLAHTFTPPAGSAASPLQPPAPSGAGFGPEDL